MKKKNRNCRFSIFSVFTTDGRTSIRGEPDASFRELEKAEKWINENCEPQSALIIETCPNCGHRIGRVEISTDE